MTRNQRISLTWLIICGAIFSSADSIILAVVALVVYLIHAIDFVGKKEEDEEEKQWKV